jgi:hypothetical protein
MDEGTHSFRLLLMSFEIACEVDIPHGKRIHRFLKAIFQKVKMATFVSRRLRLGPAWTTACRRSPLAVAPALNAAILPTSAGALASMVSGLGAPRSGTLLARFCHRLSREQEEREIYRGILSTQIKLVKTFSLCTSFIGSGGFGSIRFWASRIRIH